RGLGPDLVDQNDACLLGNEAADDVILGNMTALLGSPAFPNESNISLPIKPRGDVIFQSAGPDRVYLRRRNPSDTTERLGYGPSSLIPTDGLMPPTETAPTAEEFDDIIDATGG
ncbi:MAG: hypothetical protein VYC34_03660, partial [Planctomycetota bacterium]|nr:hypothetical protein [Planctomycetota bacterium]